MPIRVDKSQKMVNIRPPQEYLNLFWTLAEGIDEKRMEAAVKLTNLLKALDQEETSDREQITIYCLNRLIRGLGSGRKFARVGYSTALTLLLRQLESVKTNQVFSSIKDKLRADGHSFSKSEKAGLYLGRAFAFSCLIQAGRVSQLDGDMLSSMVDEILSVSGKRSYLKPVCSNTLENLISQVSTETFGEQIWPKIRDKLTLGWEECTLERISLLLVAKDKFPEIVNKKFIKKHWGCPIFSEDNDDKFVQAIITSNEKSDLVVEKIIPFILSSGRDIGSIWSSLGVKLFGAGAEKKHDVVLQRHMQAVTILTKLIDLESDAEQLLSLMSTPSVMKCIFQDTSNKQDPFSKAIDNLVAVFCGKLKQMDISVVQLVRKVFEQEGLAATGSGSQEGKIRFVHSNNFAHITNLMSQKEAKEYTEGLLLIIKGQDNWKFLSKSKTKQQKQIEWCLRQLQLIACSQTLTSPEIQRSILSLFLRLGFFKCDNKVKDIEHCDVEINFSKDSDSRQLCESFFFKSLDHLSTLNTDQLAKSEHLSNYLELLTYLVHYLQNLISCKKLTAIIPWSDEMKDLWTETYNHITSISKGKVSFEKNTEMAFLLLYFFLGFHMLRDFKTTSDLLQDLFVCEEKSSAHEKKSKKKEKIEKTEEPQWIEVLTEIILQLLSLQSHLARVVSSMVFRLIVSHLNTEAVQLIVQTLIPKKAAQDDAGGVFVEKDDADNDDNEEGGASSDEDGLLDEDIAEEDDSEEENEEDEDTEEDEEEEMEVDEKFRESVKQALGNAGIPDENGKEEEDLSDLSDSEMFKLDEVLAEVFRQRKKSGGKKAREEKKKELGNFRLRVLDLAEGMIKSDRCGFFLLDLLRPLLLLLLTSRGPEEQAARDKAKSLFNLLKIRSKGLTDSGHDAEEQLGIFQELLDLARTVQDPSQIPIIAAACPIVIKISNADCIEILKQTLANVINKKQSKPSPHFFTALFESESMSFQSLSTVLLECLENRDAKSHCRMLSCSLLAALSKKKGNLPSDCNQEQWMVQAASLVSQEFESLNKDDVKAMFFKEVMTLTLALLTRTDVLSLSNFGDGIKSKLVEVKSKLTTDSRRLANRIIAALDRLKSQGKKQQEKERHPQKQKGSPLFTDAQLREPKKKKRKTENMS